MIVTTVTIELDIGLPLLLQSALPRSRLPGRERAWTQRSWAMWGRLVSEGFRTIPHDFVAEGDKVVVLTTRELGGEATEGADVLTFNDDGKLVTFEALGDTTQADRVFAK